MREYFDIKETVREFLLKAENSFKKASKGKEDLKILIRYWGIPAFIIFYFAIDWIIGISNFFIVDLILSAIAIIYFSWHIFAMVKCKPKKKKLTKKEKNDIKRDKANNLSRSIMRKVMLQESISKWDPVTVTIVLDLYFVLLFLGNII